jgi:YD repeat-containing protein
MPMKTLALCLALCLTARAGEIRDASGKITGTSTVSGRTETIRDASGKIIQRRETNGRTVTIRNAAGQITGTERR